MSSQKRIGSNKLQVKYIKEIKNTYGKTTYLYQHPQLQSVIIIDDNQAEEVKRIREQQHAKIKRQKEELFFNLKLKPPTNLTKAYQIYKQKVQTYQNGKKASKSEISVDVIPSVIYDGTFSQCFNCVDKNEDILKLKHQIQRLKRQSNQNIKIKQNEVESYKRKYEHSLIEIKNIQKSLQQSQDDRNRFLSNLLQMQRQLSELKGKKIQTKSSLQKLDSKFVEELMQRHKQFRSKIQELQIQNRTLKNNINNEKDEEIKQVNNLIFNPQKDNSAMSRTNTVSYSQIIIDDCSEEIEILDD